MPAHPRPRGEHAGCGVSAPHDDRLIPAHAGNTSPVSAPRAPVAAHPRPRGEHPRGKPYSELRPGSSPPTRGTPPPQLEGQQGARLIPAHAGNTPPTCCPTSWPPAHPRPRGEHLKSAARALLDVGSSPPTRGTRGRGLDEALPHRLIPAHAGNTLTGIPSVASCTAHPRPRGEHSLVKEESAGSPGSSPPTRGTLLRRRHDELRLRLIPAHAGNTLPWPRCRHRRSAHPRPRGEHARELERARGFIGSSPPTRGTPPPDLLPLGEGRLIPAHAGNTTSLRTTSSGWAAHPRPRGEHWRRSSWLAASTGSSPPTRGTLTRTAYGRRRWRLIPAHAGNTTTRSARGWSGSAHPRPRGEHRIASRSARRRPGSSPPTRGTHQPGRPRSRVLRLIPAHAGNTRPSPPPSPASPAHPRPRGEHTSFQAMRSAWPGSSPPTRGTRGTARLEPGQARLIPAHAGNTSWCPCPRGRGAAHPRPRGEHVSPQAAQALLAGSSPPTRGTLGGVDRGRDDARLIPAHAGNTSRAQRVPCWTSAHPRPRGEHFGSRCPPIP